MTKPSLKPGFSRRKNALARVDELNQTRMAWTTSPEEGDMFWHPKELSPRGFSLRNAEITPPHMTCTGCILLFLAAQERIDNRYLMAANCYGHRHWRSSGCARLAVAGRGRARQLRKAGGRRVSIHCLISHGMPSAADAPIR
jgi:hypothetical protein